MLLDMLECKFQNLGWCCITSPGFSDNSTLVELASNTPNLNTENVHSMNRT